MAAHQITKPCQGCGQPLRHGYKYCSVACAVANRKPGNPAVRFWRAVDKSHECWLWKLSTKQKGYGQFAPKDHRKMVLAHRYAWELTHGPIPEGLGVLHRCDNPPCVNPAHLFLGTRADNNADMEMKGRARKRGAKGITNSSAKLTDEAVRIIRSERAAGVTLKELAHRFGISPNVVSQTALRKSWKHVT